ncbi:MAG: hypothetical protein VR70_14335 [Rhodospirillaceae bacterium BRH_c57]|nr:MAG: hypothetical protein VR70_14335 [Rhodospirillaceae bacterium BRH_c57]
MSASRQVLTHEDVTAVVGPLEDASVAAILALEPTQEELVEAWAWATSDPEPLVAAGKSLDGKVAGLYEIIAAEEEPEEE